MSAPLVEIGIMEGRLLPPVDGELQAFPGSDWPKEFEIAADCGFDCIEMIYDVGGIEGNPLDTERGVGQLLAVSRSTGVAVKSVCADYFMRKLLADPDEDSRRANLDVLVSLIERLRDSDVENIVIPFVDESALCTDEDMSRAAAALSEAVGRTPDSRAKLALEMSLPAESIKAFMSSLGNSRIGLNYDTGNSASLGYDLVFEIDTLHEWMSSVHIKDRKLGGGSCPLGEGDTDLDGATARLAAHGYDGPFIIQAQRGSDDVATARNYLGLVREMTARHYSN